VDIALRRRQVGVAGEVANVGERDSGVVRESADAGVAQRVTDDLASSVTGRAARSRALRKARWMSLSPRG
jgi:hypothetical protein